MQTHLADFIKDTPQGKEADAILRSCVHCGFCLATCPTYQLLGDELDSPRGRIYLIKEMLEGAPVTEKTQLHLDRCLTCRACETTCPSGVRYGHLLDIGRNVVEQLAPRGMADRLTRFVLRQTLPRQKLFAGLLKIGRAVGAAPAAQAAAPWPEPRHARRMLLLQGCVQPGLTPSIDAAAARVLDRLGISLVPVQQASCCGALSFHLNAQKEGLDFARRNIDVWWPQIEQGAEAIVITASGCGAFVKEYGHLLRLDPAYAARAERVSSLTRDISEVVLAEQEQLGALLQEVKLPPAKLAFHAPCTLQHGQQITGVVEALLTSAGFELTPVPDAHLCCGSAGTYSILQPQLAQQLGQNKAAALVSGAPQQIATANIGCLLHLQKNTPLPVTHWIELLDARLK